MSQQRGQVYGGVSKGQQASDPKLSNAELFNSTCEACYLILKPSEINYGSLQCRCTDYAGSIRIGDNAFYINDITNANQMKSKLTHETGVGNLALPAWMQWRK